MYPDVPRPTRLDLHVNAILVYLLPTHRVTHLLRFFAIQLGLLLLVVAWYTLQLRWDVGGSSSTTSSSSCTTAAIDDAHGVCKAAGGGLWTTTPATTVSLLFVAASLFVCLVNRHILSQCLLRTRWRRKGVDGRDEPWSDFDSKPWMDPSVTSILRLPMTTSSMRRWTSELDARMAACRPSLDPPSLLSRTGGAGGEGGEEEAKATAEECAGMVNVVKLSGAKEENGFSWEFRMCPTVEDGLALGSSILSSLDDEEGGGGGGGGGSGSGGSNDNNINRNDGSRWTPTPVPSNWTLQIDHSSLDDDYYKPSYTNRQYPFPCYPPFVPNINPTAVYRLKFALPDTWSTQDDEHGDRRGGGRSVFGGNSRYSIVVHGAESAAFVYVDGTFVGMTKDSRLPAEFDVTEPLMRRSSEYASSSFTDSDKDSGRSVRRRRRRHQQQHELRIAVPRYCDGSYLEDQDHWQLGGLHRDVELIRKPVGADLLNYTLRADADGTLALSFDVAATNAPASKVMAGADAGRRSDAIIGDGIDRRSQMKEEEVGFARRRIVAKLFDDRQTGSNGGCDLGKEVWRATIPVPMADDDDDDDDDDDGANGTGGGTQVVRYVGTVCGGRPRLWSAEDPNLYTLVLSFHRCDGGGGGNDDGDGAVQVESCRVGFRTVTIAGGMLRINERPIMVCGVNRHEHDPDSGKAISLESMANDIVLLKRNNFNAIRTSHYPNAPAFYKFCDYYGMYLCCDANLETDGIKPSGRLAHDFGWCEAMCTRVTRMAERDRNHACVVLWSLGNEAGRGRNLVEARRRLRLLDPSRPIMYEGGGDFFEGTGLTSLTDIVCPMYPSVDALVSLATDPNDDRPIILCEYSHAMGNSNGNLHLYWEQFWSDELPRLQGGFVWDMVDQGLRMVCPQNGISHFAYGGGFGDSIHDEQFCINGLFSPDREEHPSVRECKRLQQPVEFFLPIARSGVLIGGAAPEIDVKVLNRYKFLNLDHLDWKWDLSNDELSLPVATGNFAVSLEIGSSKVHSVLLAGFSSLNLKESGMYWLNLKAVLKKDASWACKGHVVASQQFNVEVPTVVAMENNSTQKANHDNQAGVITTESAGERIVVSVDGKEVACFNKGTASLMAYRSISGKNILAGPLVPNFTRAVTDNDRGGAELFSKFIPVPSWLIDLYGRITGYRLCSYWFHWERCGLTPSKPPRVVTRDVLVVAPNPDGSPFVDVEFKCHVQNDCSQCLFIGSIKYRVHRTANVEVYFHFEPQKIIRDLPSLPRVGFTMALDPSLYTISYLGRGPIENYPDRKVAADMGVWETTPKQMHTPYVVPSENGNRTDCRWTSFRDKSGAGLLCIEAAEGNAQVEEHGRKGMNFSASLFSQGELHRACRTCELRDAHDGDGAVYVNIDHALMGVGGDLSWFRCVYPHFLVRGDQPFSFSMLLSHVSSGEDPAKLAGKILHKN